MLSLIGDDRKGDRRQKSQDVSFLQYTTASSPRKREDESLVDESHVGPRRSSPVQESSSWSPGRDEKENRREIGANAKNGFRGEEHRREGADGLPSQRDPSHVLRVPWRSATADEEHEEGETSRSDLESKFRVLCRKQGSLQEQAIAVEAREKSLKTREEKYAKLLEEFGEQRMRWTGRELLFLPMTASAG
eukprot:180826-Hanusia_phi.AAC.9